MEYRKLLDYYSRQDYMYFTRSTNFIVKCNIHQGLGYAYLGKRLGCNVFAITQWTNQEPKTMAVMNEDTTFDQKNTGFYELSRFGDRQLINEFQCASKISATIFTGLR